MKSIFTLPHNEAIHIEYMLSQSYHNFGYTFHFVLFNIDNANHREDGMFWRWEITEMVTVSSRWSENMYGYSQTHQQEVMKGRAEILQKLYDQFRLHMGITNDEKIQSFFFNTAYQAFFMRMDYNTSPTPTIRRPEPKPKPVDHTPPEVKSALHLHEKWIKLQKKVYEDLTDYQKEVSEHYKKYWTLGQRFIEYIKSFIPKL